MLGINFYFRWKVSTITSLKKYLINLYWCWLYLSYTLPYIYSNNSSNFWFKVNDIFNFVNVLIAVYFIEKGNNNKIKRMSSQTRNSMILKISTSCRNCYIYFDKDEEKWIQKLVFIRGLLTLLVLWSQESWYKNIIDSRFHVANIFTCEEIIHKYTNDCHNHILFLYV